MPVVPSIFLLWGALAFAAVGSALAAFYLDDLAAAQADHEARAEARAAARAREQAERARAGQVIVETIEHDGRQIPHHRPAVMAAQTPRDHVQLTARTSRYVPPLPVDEWELVNWCRRCWDTRNSSRPVTFSVNGANGGLTRHWSREQVAAAKGWLVDIGWLQLTNPERGNYVITELGEEALARVADEERVLPVAAALASPLPRREFTADDDALSWSPSPRGVQNTHTAYAAAH
jgi:hypothetical protein